tara:strand:- start:228 stop:335 length:108 start_codon:yes stop_codon:yes gene_type:complete
MQAAAEELPLIDQEEGSSKEENNQKEESNQIKTSY